MTVMVPDRENTSLRVEQDLRATRACLNDTLDQVALLRRQLTVAHEQLDVALARAARAEQTARELRAHGCLPAPRPFQ